MKRKYAIRYRNQYIQVYDNKGCMKYLWGNYGYDVLETCKTVIDIALN